MQAGRQLAGILMACAILGAGNVRDATGQSAGRNSRPLPPATAELIADLSQTMTRLQAEAFVPGAAIALVEHSELVWIGWFGQANARTRARVTAETVFEAASLSKPVFAYAVLRLADRGLIDLDAPLTTYLQRRYVEGDDRLDRITARHVLSNTSGFPNWRPRHAPLEIFFTPGERFSYSGEGYAYLQEAVENITGQPLDAAMAELVFTPLGMTSSSFIWRSIFERRKATGHDEIGQANVRREPPSADAASSLHTTASDYARFMSALLQREGLTEARFEDMWSPQVTLDETCMICTRQPMQVPSATLSWGLGWGLETTATDTTIWHWGDNTDMQAFVVAMPAARRALVIFTNGENGLSLVPPLVERMAGRRSPALDWLRIGPTSTPIRRLHRALATRGTRALDDYVRQRNRLPPQERVSIAEMTALGHELVAAGQVALAIAVFRQNAADDPLTAKHLVHLGGAHLLAGETARAVAAFEQILAFDPWNATARGMVAELQAALRR